MLIADLHVHSKYSRGTSSGLTLPMLARWGRVKGVDILGTGDFTHPSWLAHIKECLQEDGSGVLTDESGFRFILQTEIALIYTQNKGRRVHLVVLAPDIATVERINSYLGTKGRLDYDGRPIFNLSCEEAVKALHGIDSRIEVIPAHIWTPWFSLFGARSGFDSVQDAFGDSLQYVHALETGLSSDPPMNWRLSQLDGFELVSFSDLHSYWPWRLGRETTLFDTAPSYDRILHAIRTGEGLAGTIEVEPSYGKYHYDGHRDCNVILHPRDARHHNHTCPSCGYPLTKGVLHRVEELADRPEGYKPQNAKPFYSLLPLAEVIATYEAKAIQSKAVWRRYQELTHTLSEYDILLRAQAERIRQLDLPRELLELILKNREGQLSITPGGDGVYGHIKKENSTATLDHFMG